ncbi:alcohol dehydrogenase catalytic domain-containing protein [Streptomyces sp. NPDC086669]|uniref:alcohol dehydrogenase catalytic domain-containing protein n=1 Tax=Streptomyces sp. NPDC086669 TaxID=3365753 RepID=UPI00381D8E84
MRAVVLEQFGGPLEVRETAGRPTPGQGQVPVRIHAGGVNPLDTKIRARKAAHARVRSPTVPGMDLSGQVVRTGAAVSGFAPGDEVYGRRGRPAGIAGTVRGGRRAPAGPQTGQAADAGGGSAAVGRDHGMAPGGPGRRTGRAEGSRPRPVRRRGQCRGPDRRRPRRGAVRDHVGGHDAARAAPTSGSDRLRPGCQWTGASPSTLAVSDSTSSSTPWTARPWTPPSRRCAPTSVMRSARWAREPTRSRRCRPGSPHSGEFTLLPNLTGRGRQHHAEILSETANLVDEGAPRPVLDATRYTRADVTDAHRAVENATADGNAVIDVEP